MKAQNPKVVGCPLDFPGKLVASLSASGANDTLGADDNGPGAVASGVSVYCAVPNTALGGGIRLNLFAELSGTQDHVASVVVPVGFAGLVMTVTGHIVDAWNVYQQSTNPNQSTKLSLAALSCCAEPAVKIRPSLLPYAFAAEDGLNALEQQFPFTPWGTGAEGAAGYSSLAGAAPTVNLPTRSRILHWEGIGSASDATLVFTVLTPQVRSVTIAIGSAVQRHGFPLGSLVADRIVGTDITFASVDWVN